MLGWKWKLLGQLSVFLCHYVVEVVIQHCYRIQIVGNGMQALWSSLHSLKDVLLEIIISIETLEKLLSFIVSLSQCLL